MITIKDVAEAAAEIIFSNEGSYGSVNPDDNGAVSIGKLQWHGERARELLFSICVKDEDAPRILGDIYTELMEGGSWKTRVMSREEAECVSELLSGEISRAIQDVTAINDISDDIEKGVSYGLSNCGALIYFADGANQYGRYSKLWKQAAETALQSKGSLDDLHAAVMSLASSRKERRKRTYEKVKALDISQKNLGDEEENHQCLIHKVVRGDTLSAIGVRYGVSVDALVEANKDRYKRITPDYIECGWELVIVKPNEKSEYDRALEELEFAGIVDRSMAEKISNEELIIALWRLWLSFDLSGGLI